MTMMMTTLEYKNEIIYIISLHRRL